jgi:proteic killer suppression protein
MRTLARLEIAKRPEDMDIPGLRLHPLRGGLAGFWSLTIRANWRIIFRFEGENATDIDYLDYH